MKLYIMLISLQTMPLLLLVAITIIIILSCSSGSDDSDSFATAAAAAVFAAASSEEKEDQGSIDNNNDNNNNNKIGLQHQQQQQQQQLVDIDIDASYSDSSSYPYYNTNTNTKIKSINDTILLNDGNYIPVVGLGVALTGKKTYKAVKWALQYGYRLIDTAAEESYGNENQVGYAIRNYTTTSTSTTSRSNIFVTTKLWDTDHGFYETLEAFDLSYDTLNIDYIDMYMIHSPYRGKIIETYDAILYYQSKGYIKSIGVSNFGIHHLEAIKNYGRPLPTVNQIEMHPLVYKYRLPLIEYCQNHNIKIQAYGSLMHGYSQYLTDSQILIDMQKQHYPTKSTAQILLRWALQHGFLIIPKSSHKKRIIENSQLYDFELSSQDMQILDDWGDLVSNSQRNIYEKDWGWNPIDDVGEKVRLGKTHYWPNFDGVTWDDDDEDEDEDEEEDYYEDDDDVDDEEEKDGNGSAEEL